MSFIYFVFFKQKTAYEMRIIDWSSDLCASDLFSDMDHTLCSTGWLAGKAFSLADIAYMPYLARYDFLGLAPFWAECRALSDWFARVKGRPSFTKVNIDEVAPKRIAEMVANGRANSARLLEIRQSVRATA